MSSLLEPSGRMRRKDYWISAVLTPVFGIVVIIGIAMLGTLISKALALLLIVICVVLLIWHELVENAKRCHDIGLSGWFQFIPFFGLVLLFKAGDVGPNKYGPDPKVPSPLPDDLSFRRPRSKFDEEMAAIREEREHQSQDQRMI